MSSGTNSSAMPPTLEPGGVIRFISVAQLANSYERELSEGRLSALDLVQAKLFEQDNYMIVVGQNLPRIEVRAMCVHRQGDVVGMQVFLEDDDRRRLLELLGTVGESPPFDSPPLTADQAIGVDVGPDEREELDTGGLLVEPPPSTRPPQATPPQNEPAITTPPRRTDARDVKVPDTAALDPMEQGALTPLMSARSYVVGGRGTLFRVLLDLQRACRSGQLTILAGGDHWSVFLDSQGCVVDFDIDLVDALITDGQADESARKASRGGERLSASCARLSRAGSSVSLPPVASLRSCVTKALVNKLRSLATVRDTSYFFDPNVTVYDTGVPIPFVIYGRTWLNEIAQGLRLSEVDSLFEGRMELYPVMRTTGVWSPELFQLRGAEKRFVETTLPRSQRLRELLTLSPLSRTQTLRTLFCLQAMDMVTFRLSALSEEVEDDTFEVLQHRFEQAQGGHFAALGLHITAHHTEFPQVASAAREAYGITSEIAASSPEAAQMCRQLLALIEGALRHLSDQERRIAYRREGHTETELAGFAQLLVDKMKLALLRGQQLKAVQLKQVAVELCPRVVRDALAEE